MPVSQRAARPAPDADHLERPELAERRDDLLGGRQPAQLPGRAARAAHQPAAGDDAHADAGADADEREVGHPAVALLGQRGEVEVVLERDRHLQRVLEQPAQRRTGEARGAGDQPGEAVAVRDAGDADRGAHRLAELASGRRDRGGERLAGRRHGRVDAAGDGATAVAEGDAEVRGAEVHPEHGRHAAYSR